MNFARILCGKCKIYDVCKVYKLHNEGLTPGEAGLGRLQILAATKDKMHWLFVLILQ